MQGGRGDPAGMQGGRGDPAGMQERRVDAAGMLGGRAEASWGFVREVELACWCMGQASCGCGREAGPIGMSEQSLSIQGV